MGVKVMSEALKRPIRCIIQNKTAADCGFIIEKIDEEGSFFAGFDVKKGNRSFVVITVEEICDMMESGVVDSFAVVKTILQDAVSLAGILITTECLVVKDKTYDRKLNKS